MPNVSQAKTSLLGGELVHITAPTIHSDGYYEIGGHYQITLEKALLQLACNKSGYNSLVEVPRKARVSITDSAKGLMSKLPKSWQERANFKSKYLW